MNVALRGEEFGFWSRVHFSDKVELMPFHRDFKFLILNFKLPFASRKGFTLVELLVGLGLMVITVGSTLLFLTSVFRGTNQATIVNETKQNGQVVLDSLERQIRDASGVSQMPGSLLTQVSASSGVILTLSSSPKVLYVACFPGTAGTNGWIGIVSLGSGVNPGPLDFDPLTNKDPNTGVDIQNCQFTVNATPVVAPAIVTVAFIANQAVSASSRADFMANAQFQTTISLRRY